jgi:cytochrome P450
MQTIAESLRLYPQPPVLIRRSLREITLPQGSTNNPEGFPLTKGCDMFISTWNLHRSPHLWENPDEFDPSRYSREFSNPAVRDWAGYKPALQGSSLYPNEVRTLP